jgi:predicted ATPase/DNA-binding SARP family transcriptional activator
LREPRLEFRILGPLEVVGPSGAIAVKPGKQRSLLTALLLEANRVVAIDQLVERLWVDPPRSAEKLVQVYVSQLRRALGGGADRVITRRPGYLINVGADEVDSSCFEQLLADGRAALAEGNAQRARRSLEQALALWRGPALADFTYDEFARLEAERLEELRVVAIEERLEADIALGRHEEVIGELRTSVEQHPLRERLWRLAMLALYRAGRQAEALECYAAARRTFREELGLDPGTELSELQRAILRQDANLAAAAPKSVTRTNLPAPLTLLLGREQELGELHDLMLRDNFRLVTLAGAGGSGKTSLALEVARSLVDDFANGVVVVELATIRDPALVPEAIATELGFEATDAWEALERFLPPEELLLVIDNAEHLPAAAPLFVDLLQVAPRLTLLVTSRVVLHLSGERVYPVAPLAPRPAAELFVARAEAAAPGSAQIASRSQVVEDICARLDFLPLAIELAAPYLRTLSLDELHDRLSSRLPLLAAGPRDLPARQQTLRATIEWSHALLPEGARLLLARLSVFDGGFTLEAAEQVCADEAANGVAVVATLLDANLVRRRGGDGPSRLELLETIREFAAESLEETGKSDTIRRRHAEFFLAVAESAKLTVEAVASRDTERFDRIVPEQANLRAAVDWAAEHDPALGLRLAVALEQFWVTHNPFEGIRRFELLLDRAADAPADLRARALRALGGSSNFAGDHDRAERAYSDGLELFRQIGDESGAAVMLFRLGTNRLYTDDLAEARSLLEESLESFRRLENRMGECEALGNLGSVELEAGNSARGRALIEESIAIAREIGFSWWIAGKLGDVAADALEHGEVERGEQWAREALELRHTMGGRQRIVAALALLAWAATRRDAERAGLLWGAVEAEASRGPLGIWERTRERYPARLAVVAGPDFDRGRTTGLSLSLSEAVEVALDERPAP